MQLSANLLELRPLAEHQYKKLKLDVDETLAFEHTILELAADIKKRGIRIPIKLFREGKQWHIADGLKKIFACAKIGIEFIPVNVQLQCVVQSEFGIEA